jgi:Coenzyme PQQ synthesis protein D (PqqD)
MEQSMSGFPPTSTFQRREINGSRVGDDMVLFDDRVGKYFALTPVGVDIWLLIEKPRPVSGIVSALREQYDVDEKTCTDQVESFLRSMIGNDLVIVHQETT